MYTHTSWQTNMCTHGQRNLSMTSKIQIVPKQDHLKSCRVFHEQSGEITRAVRIEVAGKDSPHLVVQWRIVGCHQTFLYCLLFMQIRSCTCRGRSVECTLFFTSLGMNVRSISCVLGASASIIFLGLDGVELPLAFPTGRDAT